MTDWNKLENNVDGVLASGINDSVTAMNVALKTGSKAYPAGIDSDTPMYLTISKSVFEPLVNEIVKVTAVDGANVTAMERGQRGTDPQEWSAGAVVSLNLHAQDVDAVRDVTDNAVPYSGASQTVDLGSQELKTTGVIAFGNGTAALPGLALATAPGTGFYREADTELAFSSGGVRRFIFHGTGISLEPTQSIQTSLPPTTARPPTDAQFRVRTGTTDSGLWVGGTGNAGMGAIGLINKNKLVVSYEDNLIDLLREAVLIETRTAYNAAADHHQTLYRAARGTEAAPAYLEENDLINEILFQARNGTGTWGDVGGIKVVATDAHGAGETPGEVQIWATKDGADELSKIAAFRSDIFLPGTLDVELPGMQSRFVAFTDLGSDVAFGYATDILSDFAITAPDGVSVFDMTSMQPVKVIIGKDGRIYHAREGAYNVGEDDTWRAGVNSDGCYRLESGSAGTYNERMKVSTDGDVTTQGDVILPSTGATYYGDPNTDGSWRQRRDGADFVTEVRVAGAWEESQRLTPPS